MRLARPSIVAALVTACCWHAHSATASGVALTSKGGTSLSAGGSLSSTGFTLGASIGYFVADNLLPGVRYFYTLVKTSDPYYKGQYHDVSIFLRYYLPHLERLFPFVVGEPGTHLYTITEEFPTSDAEVERSTVSGHYFTLYGGVGGVLLLTQHFGIEPNIGLRQVLGSGDPPELQWWLGFGFYP